MFVRVPKVPVAPLLCCRPVQWPARTFCSRAWPPRDRQKATRCSRDEEWVGQWEKRAKTQLKRGSVPWRIIKPFRSQEWSIFKSILQPYQKYHIIQYEELGFPQLTQMKDDYTTTIPITSLCTLYFLNSGVKRLSSRDIWPIVQQI